jgi:glycogen debranching enzyme
MVGLIPLFAVEVLEQELLETVSGFKTRLKFFLETRPNLTSLVSRYHQPGSRNRHLLSLARAFRMKKILTRMLDENEFLSDYGIRALSRHHLEHPFGFDYNGNHYEVKYAPGESQTRTFGGNSNWRGPVWVPLNYMIVESLRRFMTIMATSSKLNVRRDPDEC